MDRTATLYEQLICSAARRLKGHQRRAFQAEVASLLCGGSPRTAEQHFGWGRQAVATGLQEARHGIRCVENFQARANSPWEVKNPQLAEHIRALVEPHTQADPELKSSRRYTNLSARELRQQLQDRYGYSGERLPKERTLRVILNRMGYRRRRIQKAKPLKKLPQTDAIFANVAAARQQYANDPETLEISLDTKAKVYEGDYSRGGKMPNRLPGTDAQGVGPRPAAEAEVDALGHPTAGQRSLEPILHLVAGDQ